MMRFCFCGFVAVWSCKCSVQAVPVICLVFFTALFSLGTIVVRLFLRGIVATLTVQIFSSSLAIAAK